MSRLISSASAAVTVTVMGPTMEAILAKSRKSTIAQLSISMAKFRVLSSVLMSISTPPMLVAQFRWPVPQSAISTCVSRIREVSHMVFVVLLMERMIIASLRSRSSMRPSAPMSRML